tara:strand:- start:46 stop:411 length:366 start_codon:yes stop_codon:yes gene_type:complete
MKNKFILIFFYLFFLELSAAEVNNLESKIFKNLRCIVCQGQSIAESNSDFAQTIKIVVRDKIDQGGNEKEIYEFLAEKYGEWIIYKPKFNYINSVLWLSPYIVLVFGGLLILKFLIRRRKR